jgi:hypothetical protein
MKAQVAGSFSAAALQAMGGSGSVEQKQLDQITKARTEAWKQRQETIRILREWGRQRLRA